jgi:hypothetical protein
MKTPLAQPPNRWHHAALASAIKDAHLGCRFARQLPGCDCINLRILNVEERSGRAVESHLDAGQHGSEAAIRIQRPALGGERSCSRGHGRRPPRDGDCPGLRRAGSLGARTGSQSNPHKTCEPARSTHIVECARVSPRSSVGSSLIPPPQVCPTDTSSKHFRHTYHSLWRQFRLVMGYSDRQTTCKVFTHGTGSY